MTEQTIILAPIDVRAVRVLMCDADGTLFDSEGPAFEASTEVTNQWLASSGIERRFDAVELRRWALGRNFRSVASSLAGADGIVVEPGVLECWVRAERRAVVSRLQAALHPSPPVRSALSLLSQVFRLSIVTSSAIARLDACLTATDLDEFFAGDVRFSAEDSLPCPTTKPDPAVYRFAGKQMDVGPGTALAVEDAAAGVRSAVAAGFATIGLLQFVARDEREERVRALRDAGVTAIVPSWSHLARLLVGAARSASF